MKYNIGRNSFTIHSVSTQCQYRYPYCPVQLHWCQFI